MTKKPKVDPADDPRLSIWEGYTHTPGMPMPSQDLIKNVASQTDTVILSFSTGKDSLVSYLRLRPHFARIIPVYLYFIPGLEFVERTIRYYEGVMGTRILRLPHPNLYTLMGQGIHHTPGHVMEIYERGLDVFRFDHDDLFQLVRDKYGLPIYTPVALGIRAHDNPNRRATVMKNGPLNLKRDPVTFLPAWDVSKSTLISEIVASGIKLSDDYKLFGRSFGGFDLRYLLPVKKHYPEDYARILEWFPVADADIARYEFKKEHKKQGWY